MRNLVAATAAVFMLACSAFAANVDEQFVMETYGGNQHEIAMGKLAAQKATSPDVKQFGQRMVDDHSKMGSDLTDLARKMNIDVTKAPSAEDMHKQHAAQFEALNGAQWDRAFMDWAAMDHQKDVEAFENQVKSGKNADITAFANKYLPTIREHSQMAQDMNARMSKGAMLDSGAPAEQPVSVSVDDSAAAIAPAPSISSTVNESRQTVSQQSTEPLNYRQVEMGRDGYRNNGSQNVTYQSTTSSDNGTFVSHRGDCATCEVKHKSSCCGTASYWPDIVYDNDYRALETDFKDEYHDNCSY